MGLALETKLLVLHSMEKITRTQFLNKNHLTGWLCSHGNRLQMPHFFNTHFSQPCTSPSLQSTSALAKKRVPVSLPRVFQIPCALVELFSPFLAIQSRTLRSAFKTFCLWVDPETTNSSFLFFLNLGNWEPAPLRSVPGSLQWCCLVSVQQQ